ncbi:MAG: hypothetical protein ACKODH_09155, partial [Limisphaerales bacterium]
MASVEKLPVHTIITSDNPRRESPAAIAAQPIFPDPDAVPADVKADAGLRQLFRRPVTVPWLEQTEAFRTLAE